jgi:hypothetical protein
MRQGFIFINILFLILQDSMEHEPRMGLGWEKTVQKLNLSITIMLSFPGIKEWDNH